MAVRMELYERNLGEEWRQRRWDFLDQLLRVHYDHEKK